MHHGIRIILILFTLLCLMVLFSNAKKQYSYPRYHYKKKPKIEKRYKTELSRCEKSMKCQHLPGLEKTNCARQCLAIDCYEELYGSDSLEEGEVDVRLVSFKGCWLKKYFPTLRTGL